MATRLCTADRGYQTFRRFARNRFAQMLFLAWPLRWRHALAENMRAKSDEGRIAAGFAEVRRDGGGRGRVIQSRSKTTTMIHGHTHRPARHREPGGTRWVLPDWDLDHGERRGGYLRIDAEGIRALPLG